MFLEGQKKDTATDGITNRKVFSLGLANNIQIVHEKMLWFYHGTQFLMKIARFPS